MNGFVSYAFNNMLFAIKESADQMILMQGLPHISQLKQKSAICFKTDNENEPLADEDVADRVSFIEVSKKVLENLAAITNDVFLPVLTCPKNQSKYNEIVSINFKDLMDKFNVFLA